MGKLRSYNAKDLKTGVGVSPLREGVEMNWYEILDHLKVLNCTSKDEWAAALEVSKWNYQEEFEEIWAVYKTRGMFEALCRLDKGNLANLMGYVEKKRSLRG